MYNFEKDTQTREAMINQGWTWQKNQDEDLTITWKTPKGNSYSFLIDKESVLSDISSQAEEFSTDNYAAFKWYTDSSRYSSLKEAIEEGEIIKKALERLSQTINSSNFEVVGTVGLITIKRNLKYSYSLWTKDGMFAWYIPTFEDAIKEVLEKYKALSGI